MDFPAMDIKGYILEGYDGAKIFADRFEFDKGRFHHLLLMARART